MPRWATFDCYGTLIDWDGGIRRALSGLWPAEDGDALLASYHAAEPAVQREQPGLSYREVMTQSTRRIAEARGLELGDPSAVAISLPFWEPFPEVTGSLAELRERGWRLAALSNTDPDLIAASIERIGVPFDQIVTAADAGSYKPSHGHWRVFFERTGANADEHVHVAASLFHDIAPAGELALASVWINRLDERPEPEPTRELPDLGGLADTLDELVP